MSCQHKTMCCISRTGTADREKTHRLLCHVIWSFSNVPTWKGKNPNRELSETDENVTFKFNWRLFKREGCYSSSLKMTNLGEFPRNWFLANAQRIIVACLLSPLSGSVELRVFTMFVHFALKILYHLALVKNFYISLWKSWYISSQKVFSPRI